MAITSTNDKLRFLSGLQANLPTSITNGTVYVTTDEHAMYVDLGGERIRLGDFVVVDKVSSLPTTPTPHQAALYYAVAENILCRYNGTSWVQINSQKKLAELITSISTSYSAASNVGTATIKLSSSDGTSKEGTIKVSSGNTNTTTVTSNTTNGLVIKSANTIKSASASLASNKLTLTETTSGYGADGTTLSGSATVYTLEFKNNGGTVISSTETGTAGVVNINAKPKSITPNFNASGAFGISYKAADDSTVSSTTVTPTIKIGKGTQVQATFVNGTADIKGVYTAAEVDAAITNQLKTANAMVFMGAVGGTVNLPATAAHGATYIVDTAGNIKNGAGTVIKNGAQVGDLFIATGTEGADGLIASEGLTWQYVPSGNDDDVVPVVTLDDGSFTVSKKVGSAAASELGKLTFSDGLTATASGTTLAVKHATKTPTKNTDSANKTITFDAISALTFDAYGHVSAYTVSTYTIPDNAISSIADTIGTVDNAVEVTTKVSQISGNNKSDTFKITSSGNSSILVTGNATNKTVNIDICWGTF